MSPTVDDGPSSDLLRAVEPLIPRLRRYAMALLREGPAADDLVQDCLERIVGGWHRRRDDSDVAPWAFTILRNLALNHLRQARGRGVHVQLDEAEATSALVGPQEAAGLLQRDILRALDRLPEEQKSVLLLVSVEDRSYAEVARILDVPIGTVMSRLSRGRERLRRMMTDESDGASTGWLRRVK